MSPLLREINPGLYYRQEPEHSKNISFANSSGFGLSEPGGSTSKKWTVSARTEFKPGMEVIHPLFGPGKIKSVPGPRRVEIAFDRHGDKILHLDYARLEVR